MCGGWKRLAQQTSAANGKALLTSPSSYRSKTIVYIAAEEIHCVLHVPFPCFLLLLLLLYTGFWVLDFGLLDF